jgi:hypothetical protein
LHQVQGFLQGQMDLWAWVGGPPPARTAGQVGFNAARAGDELEVAFRAVQAEDRRQDGDRAAASPQQGPEEGQV